MSRRSPVTPLTLGIILMLLLAALAVGWQVLVWTARPEAAPTLRLTEWLLLVLGSFFFLVIMIGLVWICVRLVREMRLNQSQRAFLDAVTHEMKTPLASFRLGLETLDRHELEPAQRDEFLGRMGEDLDRLEYTVTQVLAAARAEETRPWRSGWGRVELQDLLAENVREVLERHGLADESVRVEKTRPLCVRGDEAELGVVFRNLLENAVKYSEDPVRIRVAIEVVGDGRVRIEISDQGIGIPKQELGRIFNRFYRASRDVQRQVSGLGLGLFVVRALLKKHGGRIVALSEGAGRGSRFVVTLRPA